MARPLRVNVVDGWYHVFHRGTARGALFEDARDREHFLELLEEVHARYRLQIHAYVLMDTHYHLVVQTPDANLSAAMQWLHLSYVAWFNARHSRQGTFWRGRFRSIPVEGGTWAYTLSLYVHLNPISTAWFGLDKRNKRLEALGWQQPTVAEATRRMKQLRLYPWSSYRAYAGYVATPAWLCTDTILERAHRDATRRRTQYRWDARHRLTHGTEADILERLTDGVGIGSAAFVTGVKAAANGGGRETSGKRNLRRRAGFADIRKAVEHVRGEAWNRCGERHGDWARPLAMWAARQYGGMTLREIGIVMGAMDYAAVSAAIKRFETRMAGAPALRRHCQMVKKILNVET